MIDRRAFLHSGLLLAASASLEPAEPAPQGEPELNILTGTVPEYRNLQAIVAKHPEAAKYIPLTSEAVQRHRDIFPVDPVLFLGLIKQESNFGTVLISYVGAAGSVQFMPSTARGMGLMVYEPDYFADAREQSGLATRHIREAIETFRKAKWNEAIRLMKIGLKHKERASKLYRRYREELKAMTEGKGDDDLMEIDQRFVDSLAVDKGVEHFAQLLKERGGDVREALSAYNAGMGNVNKAGGIPYLEETVNYQNIIVNFYKYWRKEAQ